MGSLQLVVSFLQTACSNDAEHGEYHETEQYQATDDQHAAELGTLLLYLQLFLFALQLVDVQNGVHFRQRTLRLDIVQRVLQEIHPLIESRQFLIAVQPLQDVRSLQGDRQIYALVLIGIHEVHASVVQMQGLHESSLFQSQLGGNRQPRSSQIVIFFVYEGVGIVQLLLRTIVVPQSCGCLYTGYIVIEPEDFLDIIRKLRMLADERVNSHFPFLRQFVELLIAFLLVEHVAVTGEYFRDKTHQGFHLQHDVKAFLIGIGTLVEVVHVQIDITHHIMGNGQSLLIAAFLGVIIHGFHLTQRLVLAVSIIY